MKVNYGINRKNPEKGPRIIHQNGKIELPDVPDSEWDREGSEVHGQIRATIQSKHPGWMITGYAIVRERQWIGVYVDSDEDASRLLETLALLKAGMEVKTEKGISARVCIPSLDWDQFEPSDPEEEAWRKGN